MPLAEKALTIKLFCNSNPATTSTKPASVAIVDSDSDDSGDGQRVAMRVPRITNTETARQRNLRHAGRAKQLERENLEEQRAPEMKQEPRSEPSGGDEVQVYTEHVDLASHGADQQPPAGHRREGHGAEKLGVIVSMTSAIHIRRIQ